MGRIKNDRGQLPHHRNSCHIVDQSAIAEERASFRQQYAAGTRLARLFNSQRHLIGRHELAFFDVHGLSCPAGGDQQVRLSAKERRDLDRIENLAGRFCLCGAVNVRGDGQVELAPHLGKNIESQVDARTAKTGDARSVRLVVAGFENEWDGELLSDVFDRLGQFQRVVAPFDDAGAGDDRQRRAAADPYVSDVDRLSVYAAVIGRVFGFYHEG